MLFFENDYSEGAHPRVLQSLLETNLTPQPGYGEDGFTAAAREKIRAACQCPQADVYFIAGGTQANMTVIRAYLHPTEGVVAADTGHIACHEAGAVESTGHKVLTVPGHEGKMDAGDLENLLKAFYADPNHAHMVWPGMAYISHPTEYGTLYTAEELTGLSQVCAAYKIPLYVDGARLGYGLMSRGTDVTLPVLSAVCDCFTVGGTKVGALCGEALVFPKGAPRRFFTQVKQGGALLAKGRLLGAQFDALFTEDLYFEISRHADAMAEKMKRGIAALGYPLYLDSPTNQQFLVLTEGQLQRIGRRVRFSYWERLNETSSVVRFAVSWATTEEQVDALLQVLKEEKEAE